MNVLGTRRAGRLLKRWFLFSLRSWNFDWLLILLEIVCVRIIWYNSQFLIFLLADWFELWLCCCCFYWIYYCLSLLLLISVCLKVLQTVVCFYWSGCFFLLQVFFFSLLRWHLCQYCGLDYYNYVTCCLEPSAWTYDFYQWSILA